MENNIYEVEKFQRAERWKRRKSRHDRERDSRDNRDAQERGRVQDAGLEWVVDPKYGLTPAEFKTLIRQFAHDERISIEEAMIRVMGALSWAHSDEDSLAHEIHNNINKYRATTSAWWDTETRCGVCRACGQIEFLSWKSSLCDDCAAEFECEQLAWLEEIEAEDLHPFCDENVECCCCGITMSSWVGYREWRWWLCPGCYTHFTVDTRGKIWPRDME